MKCTLILYSVIFIAVTSCDMTSQRLMLINNSENTMYYRLLLDSVITYDTYVSLINPNDSVRPLFADKGKSTWEYKINKQSADSTLYIYFLSSDIKYEELPNPRGIKVKDIIISDGNLSNKYVSRGFKVKDLEKFNWTLTYPNDFK